MVHSLKLNKKIKNKLNLSEFDEINLFVLSKIIMYECPRCEYKVQRKWDIINHLNRKKTCEFTKNDINILDCFIIINSKKSSKKNFVCKYCDRRFDRNARLDFHLAKCKNKQFDQMKTQHSQLQEHIQKLEDQVKLLQQENEYLKTQ
jgi:uncharacterized C2H2 Zn-finger protein